MNGEIRESLDAALERVSVHLADAYSYEEIDKRAKQQVADRRELESLRGQLMRLLGYEEPALGAGA